MKLPINHAPDDENAKVMLEQFEVLSQQIEMIEQALPHLTPLDEKKPSTELFRDGLLCMRLGMTFYSEAYRALHAGAWFAAAAVSSSALEAVLLAKCFFQNEEVKNLPNWKVLNKKLKADFGYFARSLDLGKLLEIANQLSWFSSSGIPKTFSKAMSESLSEDEMRQMIQLFQGELKVGELCANHLREYRNLLHPSVCLKQGREPSLQAGQAATFLFLIAIASLTEKG